MRATTKANAFGASEETANVEIIITAYIDCIKTKDIDCIKTKGVSAYMRLDRVLYRSTCSDIQGSVFAFIARTQHGYDIIRDDIITNARATTKAIAFSASEETANAEIIITACTPSLRLTETPTLPNIMHTVGAYPQTQIKYAQTSKEVYSPSLHGDSSHVECIHDASHTTTQTTIKAVAFSALVETANVEVIIMAYSSLASAF